MAAAAAIAVVVVVVVGVVWATFRGGRGGSQGLLWQRRRCSVTRGRTSEGRRGCAGERFKGDWWDRLCRVISPPRTAVRAWDGRGCGAQYGEE